jgi:hypothetical protein
MLFGSIGTGMAATPTDLFISEYVEGSSNNKAIEIFNGTGAPLDLSLGGYVLQIYSNGSTTPGPPINLTGTVANGDVFVIANSGANAAVLGQADQQTAALNFNGNDAIVLKKGGAIGPIVDAFGQVGVDPGITGWGNLPLNTTDTTLRRQVEISAGDTNASDPFDPSLDTNGDGLFDWVPFAVDTFDGLGAHGAAAASPTGTVSATVSAQAAGGASPCVQVAPSSVSYGTGQFSTPGSPVVKNASSDIAVTNCGTAAEDFLARGSNATSPMASWQLIDTGGVCDTGSIDKYKLSLGLTFTPTFFLSTTNQTIEQAQPAGAVRQIPSQLTMPCTGSSGAGQTLSLELVFTAVVA